MTEGTEEENVGSKEQENKENGWQVKRQMEGKRERQMRRCYTLQRSVSQI